MSNQPGILYVHYSKADRVMVAITYGLFVYALALVPGTALMPASVGAAFMVFTALHIHQGHGALEMHFGVFVLLATLLYYRDWLPLIVAAAVIDDDAAGRPDRNRRRAGQSSAASRNRKACQ